MDWVRCSRSDAGVAVDRAGVGAPRRARGEAVGERGAAALEELEPGGRVEVAAERELQREGALVVGAVVVGEEELDEQRVARAR